MAVCIKIFNVLSREDYDTYNMLWEDAFGRMIFLHDKVSTNQQINHIANYLTDSMDILAVRFPLMDDLFSNSIIKDISVGKGVMYKTDKVWYPKEIWIYWV